MERSATTDIAERVAAIVARRLSLPAESIAPDAAVVDQLGADSLDVLSIVGQIEAEFDLAIPTERIVQLHTVNEIAEALAAHGVPVAAKKDGAA